MKIPAIFAGVPASYIAAALIFGLVAAFGISAMTYHPLPVQVQINQYAPVKPPAPAIPTLAPAQPANPDNPFAPAPPPQIIPTQELPTIKPAEPQQTYTCDVDPSSPAYTTECMVSQMAELMLGVVPIFVLISVMGFVIGMFGKLTDLFAGRP